MPSKNWKRVGFIILFSLGLVGTSIPATGQAVPSRRYAPDSYRPGRIVIIPKAGRTMELGRFHRGRGATLQREYPTFRGTQVLELPAGADTMEAIAAYERSGLVESAEPNILFRPAVLPNDPVFVSGEQWPLHNTGQQGGLPDADLDAPEAWDRFNSASNIIVAVIDSGVRYTHEDLAANMWVNPGEIPGNGIDDDGNGFIDDIHGINAVSNTGQPLDEIGHGTHVAGIIGGVGNNGVGICGVAWKVQIMACRFLSPGQLGSLADLLECLTYAQNKGAKVVNCSFTTSVSSPGMSNAFVTLRDAGIVVAAAAGNDGTDNDVIPIYPASLKLDNIVSVTSTTRGDAFSGYNYGVTSVHLGAPGSGILSTYNRDDRDYTFETGTSMSAPHVAGALALMRAHYPQLTPAQLIARLLATADPLPSLAGKCISGGRLNLDRAVGPRDYTIGTAAFAWVPTNGLTGLTLANDGVSSAIPLPFQFSFFGTTRTQAFVAANGMVGFDSQGLNSPADSPLPSANIKPNGTLYPYWDDLNPAGGGQVWAGVIGIAPNRKFVASWIGVPHSQTTGGETPFTFQAVVHESGEIIFQYKEVQTGRNTLISGLSASIGIEEPLGQVGVRYTYHGSASVVTNGQVLMFSTPGNSAVGPSLETRIPGGNLELISYSQPGRRCVLSASSDAINWLPFTTNMVPASGIIETSSPLTGITRFYRAQLEP